MTIALEKCNVSKNMSGNKFEPLSGNERFQTKARHYHHRSKADNSTWDDWIGDKAKSPFRKKFDKAFLTISVLVVGLGLVAAAFVAAYVILQKLIPMISK
jgi:esterase/lipase